MGIASYLAWHKELHEEGVKPALVTFLVQLVLNVLWSVVFFGLQSPVSGAIVIILLWVAILFTILRLFKLSTVAGAVLIPHILWVSFAAALNISVWILNP